MVVLDYRGSFGRMSRPGRRVVERGPDCLAVEGHLALALDHVSSIALPGACGNSLRIARSVPGHHAQRGHAEAHECRLELLRGHAVLAQMRLVEIAPDLVEGRSDVVRDRRQDLV